MNRDFSKLIADYDSKFITAPATSKRWQLYVSDYSAISELATKTADTEGGGYKQILFNAIDIALKAGVMIGYNARKAEEREATRKTQKGNNI